MERTETQAHMNTIQEQGTATDSDRIKSEISETRRKMDETIERLSQRLQPRHLVDDMVGYIKSHVIDGDKAGRTFRRIGQRAVGVVTDNPVPVFLIGVGIVWILIEHEKAEVRSRDFWEEESDFVPLREEPYLMEETIGEIAVGHGWESGGVMPRVEHKFQVSNPARSAKEEIMSGMQNLKERASQAGSRVGERRRERREARRERMRHASEGYPMAMGFGFLALGMLAGLALYRRREEDRFYDETSPGIFRRTRQKAEEWAEKGKHAIESVAEGVKKEAEARGLTPEQIREKARRAEGSIKQGIAEAKSKEEWSRPPGSPQQAG